MIAKEAFSQCTELTWVIIPDSVTEIEDLAFEGCTNLPSIILPNSLKKIGWGAFVGCTGLTEIKIPNKVETIDDRAFALQFLSDEGRSAFGAVFLYHVTNCLFHSVISYSLKQRCHINRQEHYSIFFLKVGTMKHNGSCEILSKLVHALA